MSHRREPRALATAAVARAVFALPLALFLATAAGCGSSGAGSDGGGTADAAGHDAGRGSSPDLGSADLRAAVPCPDCDGGTVPNAGDLAVATGADASVTSPDLGSADLAIAWGDLAGLPSADGFVTAPHLPLPQLVAHDDAVLSSLQLVTITYQGYSFQDQVEAFGDALLASQWWKDVGTEYGVLAGDHVKKLRLPVAPPKNISDDGIVQLIEAQITAGAVPAPDSGNGQLLYVIYFPHITTVDGGKDLGVLCNGAQGTIAYHSYSSTDPAFRYAVVPDCDGSFDDVTSAASHEIIEASTDASLNMNSDGYWLDPAYPDYWWINGYDEVADMCEDEDDVEEGGYSYQRSYSNLAALAGASPCVPIPPGEIYYNLTVDPPTIPTAAPGKSLDFTLTGWSTAPRPDWAISLYTAEYTDFDPKAVLHGMSINNGVSVTLTLTVPASASRGDVGAVSVYSGDYRSIPVAVSAQ